MEFLHALACIAIHLHTGGNDITTLLKLAIIVHVPQEVANEHRL
jgi:hypothetical protein